MPAEHGIREDLDIAVIGMAGRFPGAEDIGAFWSNLVSGRDSLTFFTDEELVRAGVEAALVAKPNYVKARGVLADVEYFDAPFFRMTPNEATTMDPQIRLFLQCAWNALEDANCVPGPESGLVGVYAGAANNVYWEVLSHLTGGTTALDAFGNALRNNKDFITTQVSYFLNLHGPSLSVATACSTSLVAIHEACKGLMSGDCRLAVAGGSSIALPQVEGYLYEPGSIFSADGRCRAFDAGASGIVFGSGVAAVVLKRAGDAIEDGDFIYAVVKGSAVNNDGRRKVGYTAPSVEGQAEVIRSALEVADAEPESIGYVETHGTGTALGDLIEFKALTEAHGAGDRSGCRIGSVKTNVGHLDAASGVAGFVKAVLCLHHEAIPPSLHFRDPNPAIDFAGSPFVVNDVLTPWPRGAAVRRAAVSSFGIGGTNAHVILEEAPKRPGSGAGRGWEVLPLSAATPSALDRTRHRMAAYLETHPEADLADVAYSLQVGRRRLPIADWVIGRDRDAIIEHLRAAAGRLGTTGGESPGRLVFLFAGQGSQYTGMARELYEREAVFRKEMDRCARILRELTGVDYLDLVYPSAGGADEGDSLRRTLHAQPIIVSLEYALGRLLASWGIHPDVVLGFSLGEYAAANAAGMLSLEDTLRLVSVRAELMDRLPPGGLLSVPLGREEVDLHIEEFGAGELDLAIDNGQSCVVAGDERVVADFERFMRDRRVLCAAVPVGVAAHSAAMVSMVAEFRARTTGIVSRRPLLPYLSAVAGSWIGPNEAIGPAYWERHLCGTVQFAKCVRTVANEEGVRFLELGPGRDLTLLARRFGTAPERFVHAVRHPSQPGSDQRQLLVAVAQLWCLGQQVDWAGFHKDERRQLVPVPGYPFDRHRYWIEGSLADVLSGASAKRADPLTKLDDISEWFYEPRWAQSPLVRRGCGDGSPGRRTLVFIGRAGAGRALASSLESRGHAVVTVGAGERFARLDDTSYVVDPDDGEGYVRLWSEANRQEPVDCVVHCWSVTDEAEPLTFDDAQRAGYRSLLALARAVRHTRSAQVVRLVVVSNGLHEVTGEERLFPEKATLLGPCKVMRQEIPNLVARNVDVVWPDHPVQQARVVERLVDEVEIGGEDVVAALRGAHRWAQHYTRVRRERPDRSPLRTGGHYLITGGLGQIGLILAEHLVRTVRAKVTLVSRSGLPPRAKWPDLLRAGGPVAERVSKIMELEDLCGQVLVLSADVSSATDMGEVVRSAEAAFGPLHGVVHAAGRAHVDSAQRAIEEIGPAETEDQFRAKVDGVRVLGHLLGDRPLDFCILVSSLAPILGGLGFSAYAGANAFVDAFVYAFNREAAHPWLVVNWGDWRYEGGVSAGPPVGERIKRLDMAPAEGVETFDRVIGPHAGSQVVVSAGDLQVRLREWVELRSLHGEPEEASGEDPQLHPRPSLSTPYAAPGNEVEGRLADIWAKLFKIGPIGVDDDFFELGGDSLKAITAVSRIQAQMDVEIPLTAFLANPTVRALATRVAVADHAPRADIEPVPARDAYPLSSAQRRFYLLHRLSPTSVAYNDTICVSVQGELDADRVEAALRALIERHESLRTSFHVEGGEVVQRVHDGAPFQLERSSATSDDEVRGRIAALVRPFQLDRAPLMRGLLVALQGRQVLALDVHHIVTDGHSQELLLKDFMGLYEGRSLASLAIQYKDYVEWQRGPEELDRIARAGTYWLETFRGATPAGELPRDHDRAPVPSFEGGEWRFEVGPSVTGRLRRFAMANDTTVFSVLLAAFHVVLARYTGNEVTVIGSPVAGRHHEQVREVVGAFVNMLVLRNEMSWDTSWVELVKRVTATTRQAIEHQRFPYEQLVAELGLQGNLDRNALFDVAFTFQGYVVETRVLDGARIGPFAYPTGRALFDLLLRVEEAPDRLLGAVEYARPLFKEETVEEMFVDYLAVLEQVLDNPERRLRHATMSGPSASREAQGPDLGIGEFVFDA